MKRFKIFKLCMLKRGGGDGEAGKTINLREFFKIRKILNFLFRGKGGRERSRHLKLFGFINSEFYVTYPFRVFYSAKHSIKNKKFLAQTNQHLCFTVLMILLCR